MMKSNLLLITAAFGVLATASARAATVTDIVNFSANGFQLDTGSGTAIPTVTGSFTLTFDPTQIINGSTNIVQNSLTGITLGSGLEFDYNGSGTTQTFTEGTQSVAVSPGELIIGGSSAGGAGVIQYSPSTDDFYMQILNATTAPSLYGLGYTQTSISTDNLFTLSSDATVSVTVTPAPVPLPAAAWLLLSGLCSVGAIAGRRRRAG